MSNLQIEFQSTLASQASSNIEIPWLEDQISARELITRTVLEQCRLLAAQREHADVLSQIARQYLRETDIARMQQDGRIALPVASSEPDSTSAVNLALDAFRRRRFLLLVGDQQILDETTIIPLSPYSAIRFVRLIPLKGG
ncbi:hypothetical protein HZU75_08085 [Chitinibacter fontanus]|uniref:Uncharacterized protein n=1 Tax=Chitinibacter fontanus TaxID=1737446 RepID=A0A7D5ZGH4_9NEIS|nr:hypothetical protein [Chitinibacter fontanus]QLI81489.1 hypothetical protein HZU75_08085 [Chitinibacter fontanus]